MKKLVIKLLVIGLLSYLGAGNGSAFAQAAEGKAKKSLSEEELKYHKMVPTDILAVDVYGESDLSREVEIDRNGFITYPLIGRIKVEGLNKEEVEKKFRGLLEQDYLVNPIVTVRIVPEKSTALERPVEPDAILQAYILLGEVRKPGTYEFNVAKGRMTLLKAVSIAGGFTDIANISKVKLLRRDGAKTRSVTINAKDIISGKRQDEELMEDDLIVVPESLF